MSVGSKYFYEESPLVNSAKNPCSPDSKRFWIMNSARQPSRGESVNLFQLCPSPRTYTCLQNDKTASLGKSTDMLFNEREIQATTCKNYLALPEHSNESNDEISTHPNISRDYNQYHLNNIYSCSKDWPESEDPLKIYKNKKQRRKFSYGNREKFRIYLFMSLLFVTIILNLIIFVNLFIVKKSKAFADSNQIPNVCPTNDNSSQLIFTICNLNPIRGTRLFTTDNGDVVYDQIVNSSLHITSSEMANILENNHHSFKDMLKSFILDDTLEVTSEQFKKILTQYGVCYQTVINQKIKFLSFSMDPQEYDYLIVNNDHIGIHLWIHMSQENADQYFTSDQFTLEKLKSSRILKDDSLNVLIGNAFQTNIRINLYNQFCQCEEGICQKLTPKLVSVTQSMQTESQLNYKIYQHPNIYTRSSFLVKWGNLIQQRSLLKSANITLFLELTKEEVSIVNFQKETNFLIENLVTLKGNIQKTMNIKIGCPSEIDLNVNNLVQFIDNLIKQYCHAGNSDLLIPKVPKHVCYEYLLMSDEEIVRENNSIINPQERVERRLRDLFSQQHTSMIQLQLANIFFSSFSTYEAKLLELLRHNIRHLKSIQHKVTKFIHPSDSFNSQCLKYLNKTEISQSLDKSAGTISNILQIVESFMNRINLLISENEDIQKFFHISSRNITKITPENLISATVSIVNQEVNQIEANNSENANIIRQDFYILMEIIKQATIIILLIMTVLLSIKIFSRDSREDDNNFVQMRNSVQPLNYSTSMNVLYEEAGDKIEKSSCNLIHRSSSNNEFDQIHASRKNNLLFYSSGSQQKRNNSTSGCLKSDKNNQKEVYLFLETDNQIQCN